MAQRLHRLQDEQGNPLSYSALAELLLKADGLSERHSCAILEPLLAASPRASRDEAGAWRIPEACLSGRFLPQTTFAVVDIETTGGRPPQHRITELAAVRVKGGKITGDSTALVNPGREIPWSVVRLTGITDALVADCPDLMAVMPGFLDAIEGSVFVAHCANFDLQFIRYFAGEFLGREFNPPVLCTFKLAQQLLPQAGRYNLGELAAYLGLPDGGEERHRALGDARVTAEILLRLLRMLQLLGVETLDEVLARQEGPQKEAPPLAEGASIGPEELGGLPAERGVFRLIDDRGRTVYAGRAADIQRAVRDLFYPRNRAAARFAQRLRHVRKVEAQTLESELGMSLRAARLIRGSHLMNGSSPGAGAGFLKVGTSGRYPRVSSASRFQADEAAYYGPFRKQAHLQDLVGAIHSVFPLRRLARGKDGEEAKEDLPAPPELSPRLYGQLIQGLQAILEGRISGEEEHNLIGLLERAWNGHGPSSARLRRQFGRLRHLIQSHGLSGPSVECRNLVIVEPGETRRQRVCYFVRRGLLAGEMEFDRGHPPSRELGARIREIYFGPEAEPPVPSKEEIEEAAIIAAWLRRELMDGFLIEIIPGCTEDQILGALVKNLQDPRVAGTVISV
ncbi:MAG: exonuclease domain-containing protein [Nitrospinota bacterium]